MVRIGTAPFFFFFWGKSTEFWLNYGKYEHWWTEKMWVLRSCATTTGNFLISKPLTRMMSVGRWTTMVIGVWTTDASCQRRVALVSRNLSVFAPGTGPRWSRSNSSLVPSRSRERLGTKSFASRLQSLNVSTSVGFLTSGTEICEALWKTLCKVQ